MTAEDFSFPAVGKNSPSGMDSPPLWNLSPASSPYNLHGSKEKKSFRGKANLEYKEDRDCFSPNLTISCRQRKSFSDIQNGRQRVDDPDDDDDDDEEEAKMDSLWEDFNEELTSRTSSTETSSSSKDTVGLGCVQLQPLAISKGRDGRLPTTSRHKAGMALIMKVWKKLFLLHNSQLKLNKNGRDRVSSFG